VNDSEESDYADIAASFQEAVIDVLTKKVTWALEDTGHQRLICSGGVAANKNLRERLQLLSAESNIEVLYPSLEFCTDNAAMIAYAGYIRKKFNLRGHQTNFARPRWPLGELYA